MLLRLTCIWGWHRTLGTASVIIKILQMAGAEVILYSEKLSLDPRGDSPSVIAFLQESPNVCLAGIELVKGYLTDVEQMILK